MELRISLHKIDEAVDMKIKAEFALTNDVFEELSTLTDLDWNEMKLIVMTATTFRGLLSLQILILSDNKIDTMNKWSRAYHQRKNWF